MVSNSTPFTLRLIFNALTTPHVFLGGDVGQHQRHCANADRAIALVALSLFDATAFTVTDAVSALVTSPDGATGEDFLGYTCGPALHFHRPMGVAQARRRNRAVTDGISGALTIRTLPTPAKDRPVGPSTAALAVKGRCAIG